MPGLKIFVIRPLHSQLKFENMPQNLPLQDITQSVPKM